MRIKRSLSWKRVLRRFSGILLLKLQKKEISEETRKAQEAISTLLAMLSNYYIEDKKRRIGILINEIEMKNILVTGANGQLGNEMRVLSAEYKEYTCFFYGCSRIGHL